MSFKWNADSDQGYGEENGTQIVKGVDFSKKCGKSFVMNAPDETLTLRYDSTGSKDPDIWIWGMFPEDFQADETAITVRQGILVLNGLDDNPDGADHYPASLQLGTQLNPPLMIRVENQSELHLKNMLSIQAQALLHTEPDYISCLTITDHAKLAMNHETNATICNLEISLMAEKNAQLELNVHTLNLYTQAHLKDNAQAALVCQSFALNSNFIKVAGNATCSLKAETGSCSSGVFILDAGQGKLVIHPTSQGTSPFNFPADKNLRKGMFDFLRSGKGNYASELQIHLPGFWRVALESGEFLAINGDPVGSNDIAKHFDVIQSGNSYTYKLKAG
ncbi:hypothetical protein [Brucella pituitosa]|uniref:hypothetical protein n=1 Tax=Brucella pituitosa TaxID=571256 RepID=UPI0009A20633|nr:hypothetical protein [Brucella pituitosa]